MSKYLAFIAALPLVVMPLPLAFMIISTVQDQEPSAVAEHEEPSAIVRQETTATAVPTSDAALNRIRENVQAKFDKLRLAAGFPGATIGFVLPDGRSSAVATGVSDLASHRRLVPSDLMLAGSIGKTFVSAEMLQLAQEGKVDLDAKIENWFKAEPWFPRLPNRAEITVRMLLNHSSGIRNHADDVNFFKALVVNRDRSWKPEELVAFVIDKPPLFPAGKGSSYSDTNYILAGMVIERVTGTTLYNEVTRRFLEPLKLSHTIPQEGRVIAGVVNGYSAFGLLAGPQGAMIVGGKFTINPQAEWAGGGFASTSEDLARWAKALYEGGIIKKPYFEQMLEGIRTDEGGKYGLGVEIGEGSWGKAYGHDGLFPGYVSVMAYFPQYKVAVAIQLNTDRPKQLYRDPSKYVDDVMRIVVSELTGKKLEDPSEHKQIVVPQRINDAYAGQYEIKPGSILTISRQGDHLVAQATGQTSAEIFPASETDYFYRVVDAQIKFVRNEQGQVTSLVISQNGRDIPAKKIK